MLISGEIVGRYRIGDVLGSGGVGMVYSATHTTLGTEHALKALRVDDPEGRRRLMAEARTQARLDHPNIVPARDTLELKDGRPVLVFDRVHGPTLKRLLKHALLDSDEAVRLWLGVVRGVAHAHANGVIHRDIKPENIILDTHVTPPSPRVTDFGIAKCLAVPGATAPGHTLGTPGYLAPEQLLDAGSATCAADVFSLGVLLVELVTGERAFAGAEGAAWLRAVEANDGSAPAGVPAELRPVLARCLRLRPEDRFRDAQALARALPGTGHDAGIVGEPAPRRLPWLAVGLVAGLSLVAGGVAGLAWSAIQVPQSTKLRDSREMESRAWTRSTDNPAEALALLRAARWLRGEDVPDSLVLDLVGRGGAVRVLPMPDAVPTVAARAGKVAALTTGGLAAFWDVETGRLEASFSTGVYQPRWTTLWPGGDGILVRNHPNLGTSRTEALTWDKLGRARIYAPGASDRVVAGDLVVARVGQELVAWNLAGDEVWRRSAPGSGGVYVGGDLVFSGVDAGLSRTRLADGMALPDVPLDGVAIGVAPDGASAMVRSESGVTWLDLQSGETRRRVQQPGKVFSLAWQADGAAVAVWSARSREVRLLRSDGVSILDDHSHIGVQAAFMEDGQVVSTSWDGQVRLWGRGGQLLQTLGRHDGLIVAMAVDGEHIVTGSLDQTVRVWARPDRLLGSLGTRQGPELSGAPWTVERLADGVIVGGHDGTVTQWQPASHARTRLYLPSSATAVGAAGGTLVGVDFDGRTVARHGDTYVALDTIPQPARVVVSPDGGVFAVLSQHRIGLWTRDGIAIGGGSLTGYEVAARFSESGERLFVGHGEAGHIDVWTVATGSPTQTLRPELMGIRGVSELRAAGEGVVAGFYGGGVAAWAADGTSSWARAMSEDVLLLRTDATRVLVGSRDGAVRLHDLANGEVRAEVEVEGEPSAALFRPDGVILGDSRGRLVDWRTSGSARTRPAHRGPVEHIFATDGAIWTVGVDGLARAWREAELSKPVGDLASTGRLTNLRVCEGSFEVVPVVPYPSPTSVWAPADACAPDEF